jgi:hypothetical protein
MAGHPGWFGLGAATTGAGPGGRCAVALAVTVRPPVRAGSSLRTHAVTVTPRSADFKALLTSERARTLPFRATGRVRARRRRD